jgi:hypothetical protein
MAHFKLKSIGHLVAILLLAACSSEATVEGPPVDVPPLEQADAALDDPKPLGCIEETGAGAPCISDLDCKGGTICELPRCDAATNKCIVTAGPPDGEPCGPGLVCSSYRCCPKP